MPWGAPRGGDTSGAEAAPYLIRFATAARLMSDHARDQMADRRISERQVREVVADPDSKRPDKQRPKDRQVLEKRFGRRTIRVVVQHTEKVVKVVTTWPMTR